jgi:vitamin B12 transporter
MRTSRLWRQAVACRDLTVILVSVLAFSAPAFGADALTGLVVDQSGQPLPRAFVRALDASGAQSASAFSDESGAFRLAPVAAGCRVEASLSGFATAAAPCGSDPVRPLRIVLQVAPVEETVVVTATRTETPSEQVGAAVAAFTAADLERRRTPTVADLLRSTPGAMIVRVGGIGAVTSLFVRGGESNHNKVLLDGIPLNEPGGTFNFSNVTTDGLERVEIVRGAQSALFGSDAMASVVQLFTKRAGLEERPHVAASIEGGTYDTVNGGASVSGRSGRFDYMLGAGRFITDNREPNNHFSNTTISLNLGVALGSQATLRVVGRGALEHAGTPGQTAFGRPDLDAFFERHDGTGGVTFDQQLTSSIRQRASYSLAISHQTSTNLTLDPPYTPQFDGHVAPFAFSDFPFDLFNTFNRHHASYQADVRIANGAGTGYQLLTVLADWDGERATLRDRLAATEVPASRNNSGVAVQHQAQWRRVVVTASGRVEHNDSFGNAAVPRGSMVFVAHDAGGAPAAVGDTRIRAAAGLGIKEPTVLQSFSPSPFFRGNPDLAPERSRSVEAGIDQRLARDRVRIEATWFASRYRNLISTRTTNPATFEAEYFNIGVTRARGLELAADATPVGPVRVRAGYTFLASEIVESTAPRNIVFQPGQWLTRRPRHSGFVGFGVERGRVDADLTGVFIGRFVDSDFSSLLPPLVENPGYTTWNARFSYRFRGPLSALVSVDNLANADYMEPLGYRALGRALRVGVRVGF